MTHATCQCLDHDAEGGCPGPAAYQVMRAASRGGVTLKVCTRCTLASDTAKLRLVGRDDPIAPYMEYDALGAILLACEADERGPHERMLE